MLYVIVGRGMSDRNVRAVSKVVPEGTVVVVDRRVADRRVREDRRALVTDAPYDRRRVAGTHGRRVADRRALTIPAAAPPLPRRLRRHMRSLAFVTRLAVPADYLDAVATARLALAGQAGDRRALLELYEAHFDSVYAFARMSLRDADAAEAAAQRTFAAMLDGIESFDPVREPFRTWLFRLALEEAAEEPEPEPQGPVRGPRRAAAASPAVDPLRWVADRELRLLVERLPVTQRHVVLLRHLAGLPPRVVADMLAMGPEREEQLHAAALASVSSTLAGLGAAQDTMQQREHMRRLPGMGRVLRERRLALKG